MQSIELKVSGMSCEACVEHVTRALQNVRGVQAVQVNLPGTARVEGEDLDVAALVAAVEEEGYSAQA